MPLPDLHVDVEPRDDGGFTVRLLARRYARDVWLSTTDPATGVPAVDGAFDDNDLDLLPGETETVVFRPSGPTSLTALRAGLGAVSLVDSY